MDKVSLEQIIRTYVALPPTPAATGWYPITHQGCDHGRKGPRAAFHFDPDGSVAFHCFNCGVKTGYNPAEHETIPRKMVQVLTDFHVPEEDWKRVQFNNLTVVHGKKPEKEQQVISIEPMEIPLPKTFYLLKDASPDDKWATIARYYLEEQRGVNPSNYPFMLSKRTDDPRLKKWFGRVIYPIYKDGKLIYYQGRDLTGKAKKKYESPAVSKEKVLFGFDKLFENTDLPLYIVEGWFDAFAIDGVAILGNELSKSHIAWLQRSRRKKVYVPDRFGDGKRAAIDALERGWSVSTPDIGQCKDMSEAVHKYGRLYVLQSLAENTADEKFEAMAKLGIYCSE